MSIIFQISLALAVFIFRRLYMKTNNHKDGFFVKAFNIQNKKFPKISLFFIFTIIFEFVVAAPVYLFLSKKIGALLFIIVILAFWAILIYFIFKVGKYFLNKKR